jgi:long-chain acyl-CoA synthetase
MVVGGESYDYITALIIMDFENAGKWAERRRLGYTTYLDLCQKAEIYNLVQEVVCEVNQTLPTAGRIKRFVLMHKEFDADEAEMTRSRKLRRNVLYDKYDDIIKAMYNGVTKVDVRATIQYQDGSQGSVETSLQIATV